MPLFSEISSSQPYRGSRFFCASWHCTVLSISLSSKLLPLPFIQKKMKPSHSQPDLEESQYKWTSKSLEIWNPEILIYLVIVNWNVAISRASTRCNTPVGWNKCIQNLHVCIREFIFDTEDFKPPVNGLGCIENIGACVRPSMKVLSKCIDTLEDMLLDMHQTISTLDYRTSFRRQCRVQGNAKYPEAHCNMAVANSSSPTLHSYSQLANKCLFSGGQLHVIREQCWSSSSTATAIWCCRCWHCNFNWDGSAISAR